MRAVVEGRDAVVLPVGVSLFKVLLPARIQSTDGLIEKQKQVKPPCTYGKRIELSNVAIYINRKKIFMCIPLTGLDSYWVGSDPTRWNRSWSKPRERPDTGSNRCKSALHPSADSRKRNKKKNKKTFFTSKSFARTTRGRSRREGMDVCVHVGPPFI